MIRTRRGTQEPTADPRRDREGPASGAKRYAAYLLIWSALVLAGAVLVHTAEDQQRTTVEGAFAARAETSAQFLESYTEAAYAYNKVLATASLTGPITPAAFNSVIRSHGVEAASVLDDQGRILAIYPSDPKLIGSSIGTKYPHLASALDDVPAVSDVVLSLVRRTAVVGFAVPFDTPEGRRVFSAGYEVSRTPMSSYLTSDIGKIPEAIYLVDRTDKIVASGGTRAVRAVSLSDADPTLADAARSPGTATIDMAGASWRTDTIAVRGTPWRLVFASPAKELYGSINAVEVWTLRLTVVAFALAGLVTIALLERMLRQRSRLADQQLESAAVLESAADAFVGTDQQGDVVAWNGAAEALFGPSPREALGRPFTELVTLGDHGLSPEDRLSDLLPLIAARPNQALELTAHGPDGDPIPVELSISSIRLSGGERTYAFFRDIRARRVAEEQMRISAQAAESAGDAIYTRDRDGRMLSWNPSAVALFGWTETESVGRGLDHPPVGAEHERMVSLINSAIHTGAVQHVETVKYHRDGHPVDISLTLAPLLDEYGYVTGVTATARDIGDRLRLEEQLRQSAAVFRSAFDDALLGMFLTEPNGRVIRVNSVFAAMLGRPQDELVGSLLDEVTHPDYRGRSGPRMEEVMESQDSGFRDEMCYLGREGSLVWAETAVSLVRDQFGAPLHFVTQVIDVTARRAALRERDSRDAMLAAVIANSQSLISIKDLDGRYLLVNEPFQQAFRLTEADLIGREGIFLHPEPALTRWSETSAADPAALHLDQRSDIAHGSRLYESVIFPLHDAEGRIYAVCAVCLDVTEKRSAAAAVAKALDDAVAATAAKSSFLATMSHEIRTPMNAVIGLTGLLLDTELDLKQREFVETINRSGDALLTVINDVLDFSKIEAGELKLEERLFDLTELVEGSVDLVAASAASKGLDLICYVDKNCPARVMGDVARLRQVLVNLVSNAVKFTATGDVLLSVTAGPGLPTQRILTYSVTDTGIGIPPDRMDRLFRSFSQVDDSTTREYGGTGLGLAISQRLVQAMGGEITATSIAGAGSTFMFSVASTVPLVAMSEAESVESTVVPALAGKRALIVDGNATVRHVLAQQLSRYSMSCAAVGTAAEALASLSGGPAYDVALIDMRIPDADGLSLAAAVRHERAAPELPVVMLTTPYASLDIEPTVIRAVLSKPLKSAAIRATLLSVLGPPPVAGDDPITTKTPPALDRGRVLRVLLVEDNLVNQRVAQLMLTKLGHRVDTVGNGKEALAAAHSTHYDAILMDVQMPVMDGLETTRRIRAELAPSAQPYIIAMTASALVEDQGACADAGMDGYLAKPVRQLELRRSIEQAVAMPSLGGR